ncbi:laccase domain-containing protein [Actinomyces sp. 594]|uniref:polyphenol oxidase family protein n=1 Tax=Actinomyces sp. 594 TaxID=2057793 RepID=UPI001C5808B1|nr:laccase domain-containing protein [Actinomyces sp. 594]MBW3069737.1 laccase domain-containing protein [Actinomyces sp. 594]
MCSPALIPADLGAGARGYFTTRTAPDGPDSDGGPYAGFNLAVHVGDDTARVADHRDRLAQAIGLASDATGSASGCDRTGIAWMNQVHSTGVAAADAGAAPTADALLLDARAPASAAAAAVLVADCVPVLLAGADGAVVAAVHAGRRGLLMGIVPAVLAAFGDLGVDPTGICAAVGPAICGACYEVPEQLRLEATAVEPACHAVTRWGTPGIDLAAGVCAQLERAGVGGITRVDRCTYEEPGLYSYRRDGVTGRQAGVVVPAP